MEDENNQAQQGADGGGAPEGSLEQLASGEPEAPAAGQGEEGQGSESAPGSATGEEAPKPSEGEDEDGKPKPQGGEPRINKAERDWGRLRQDRRELRTKVAQLEAENAKLKGTAGQPGQQQEAAPPAFKPEPFAEKRPALDDFQNEEDPLAAFHEALGAYGAKKTLHEAEQTAKAREIQRTSEAQRTSAAQQASESWVAKLKNFKESHSDFDAAIEELKDEVGEQIPGHLNYALLESEQGPALLYYLGQHPEEASSIWKMSPGKAALALGRIEAKLPATQTPSEKPKKQQVPPPAPKPATVLRSGGAPPPKNTAEARTMAEYRRLRQSEA